MASHPTSLDPRVDLASPHGPLVIEPARVRSPRGQRAAAVLIGLLTAIVGFGLAGPRDAAEPAAGAGAVSGGGSGSPGALAADGTGQGDVDPDGPPAGRDSGPSVSVAPVGDGSGLGVLADLGRDGESAWVRLSSGPTILVEQRIPASAGLAATVLLPRVPRGGLLATLIVAVERPDGSTTARALDLILKGSGSGGLAVDPATGRTRLATAPGTSRPGAIDELATRGPGS